MISFYPLISVHNISSQEIKRFNPSGQSFKNINTPEELANAEHTFNQTGIAA